MNLYTRYRPARFEEILGQGQSIQILKNQARARSFHHAYLLYGASGTGKTSTARILAMAFNCPSVDGTGQPCGECPSCHSIRQGRSWDVIEIDAAQFRGIDDVRELKARAYLCPLGNRKVYIIDEAHMLTEQAWSAMLKLLEEPPPHLVVILCTTQADRIPLTVRSRCQHFPFHALKPLEVRGKLERIATDQGVELDPRHLQFIVESAAGNMRSAENLLEQCLTLAWTRTKRGRSAGGRRSSGLRPCPSSWAGRAMGSLPWPTGSATRQRGSTTF